MSHPSLDQCNQTHHLRHCPWTPCSPSTIVVICCAVQCVLWALLRLFCFFGCFCFFVVVICCVLACKFWLLPVNVCVIVLPSYVVVCHPLVWVVCLLFDFAILSSFVCPSSVVCMAVVCVCFFLTSSSASVLVFLVCCCFCWFLCAVLLCSV